MRCFSIPASLPFLCVCVAFCCQVSPVVAQVQMADDQFFEERIRPVLVQHCQECHGARKQESGLRLDARQFVLSGGDSGPAIVAGRPDQSLLIEAVKRESLEMPPEQPLSADTIADLERWVQRGAVWPASDTQPAPALGDQQQIRSAAGAHWAFQPIRRPEIPVVSQSDWVQVPIDAFILARLEAAGLSPSRKADRRSLLRRAWIDAIGLPPSMDQIAAFSSETSDDAFAQVVDQLLESKHFGERWARRWLDIARYADTRDWQAQTDIRYPYAYTFRDWVVDSLNADMPYDRFIQCQIAADYLVESPDHPDMAALGFLSVGPRFRNNRLEQVADQIDVVTRGVMGLTVTCARCHDHKYDPVPIEDYYSLYGVFANTEFPEELPRLSGSSTDSAAVKAFEAAYQAKVDELVQYGDELKAAAELDLRQRIELYLTAYYDLNVARKDEIRGVISKHKVMETAMTPMAANLDRMLKSPAARRHPVWGPLALLLNLPNEQAFAARYAGLRAELQDPSAFSSPVILAALDKAPPRTRRDVLVVFGRLFAEAQSSNAVELAQFRKVLDADSGPFRFDRDDVVRASRLFGKGRVKLGQLESAIKEVEASHPGAPPRAMSVQDRERLVDSFVMLRGEPSRRGDRVPRRFLSFLAGEDPTAFEQGSGRLELARAVTAADNPLTARVYVNRVWMLYFGQGLVASPGDFGLRSDPPTHPELLDYLASEFMAHGWSRKWLHRQILLSATYQQSSEHREAAAEIDPENRLLWRMNRKRLDFEAMRDSMLAATGEIDLTIGGRSIPLADEPFTRRRTIYGYVDRVEMDPIFKTFDFASPDASAPERPQTTVPQQALFAMNHPFVVEQARMLASRATQSGGGSDRIAVEDLYQSILGRSPANHELRLAELFLSQARTAQVTLEAGPWFYGFGPAAAGTDRREAFTPLTHWTGQAYQIAEQFPHPQLGHLRLTATGGTPGRDDQHAVVRRWVAPRDGRMVVRGRLIHNRDKGNGIMARIISGDGRLLGEWPLMNDEVETSLDPLMVREGDVLDFVVDCRGNANSDAFTWTTVVRIAGSMDPSESWNSRTGFSAPPPPPLDGLAQLAQALLLTNEFLFVD